MSIKSPGLTSCHVYLQKNRARDHLLTSIQSVNHMRRTELFRPPDTVIGISKLLKAIARKFENAPSVPVTALTSRLFMTNLENFGDLPTERHLPLPVASAMTITKTKRKSVNDPANE